MLVASSPQLVFRHLELASTEAVRPDVALVPLPFLRYPGVAQAPVRAHPALRELVNDFLARSGSAALAAAPGDLASRCCSSSTRTCRPTCIRAAADGALYAVAGHRPRRSRCLRPR